MNIPLNIDWQQILLHLLNFAVLTLGLYLLLYEPVRGFMQKRTEHYWDLNNQTEAALKQARKLEKSYLERMDGVEMEIQERKTLAAQEAKQAGDALMQSARDQAEMILADARKAARLEHGKILDASRKDIAAMAIAATERLLADSTSDSLDSFLYAVKKE